MGSVEKFKLYELDSCMPRFSPEQFNSGSNYNELYFEEAEARTVE